MPLLERLLQKDRPKTCAETLSKLQAAFAQLQQPSSGEANDKARQTIAKYLAALKLLLFGEDGHEVTKESVLEVAREVVHAGLLGPLVRHLSDLDFESRKDAAQVFSAIMRVRDSGEQSPGGVYMQHNPDLVAFLFDGYDDPNIALSCGSMLRDCFRDAMVARQFLESHLFLHFFDAVEVANFEVASDAFNSFKDLLTRNKEVVAQYLMEHYQEFFSHYMNLLKSTNYVTRRQSLKLLGELLLDRSNVKVMVRFVSEVQHLMQMMMLLKDQFRSIQFEAFHVFKVFVANPKKPQAIIDILTNNKEKLLKYLEDFHSDRDESDEMFKEEKAVLIREISNLGQGQHPQAGASHTGQASAQQHQ